MLINIFYNYHHFFYMFFSPTISESKWGVTFWDKDSQVDSWSQNQFKYDLIYKSRHRMCSAKKVFSTLLKRSLWHSCFPVNFAKFLRTASLQNTSGRLLLNIVWLRFFSLSFLWCRHSNFGSIQIFDSSWVTFNALLFKLSLQSTIPDMITERFAF